MEDIDIDIPKSKAVQASTYQVPKKLFWPVILVVTVAIIVLLVLTIYFGTNQKNSTNIENRSTTTMMSSTTTSLPLTSTISPLPPVERIPGNLEQQSYQLIIEPNLTKETFTGNDMK